jgi:hypothetical protein
MYKLNFWRGFLLAHMPFQSQMSLAADQVDQAETVEESGSRVARMPTLAAKSAAKMGHPAFVLGLTFVSWSRGCVGIWCLCLGLVLVSRVSACFRVW